MVLATGRLHSSSSRPPFSEGGSGKWHFNAVFDSLVRVHLGKTLLVDSAAQYGLYAWFLSGSMDRTVRREIHCTDGFVGGKLYAMIRLFLKRQTNRP